MTPTVTLHIGPHKTGSSYVQSLLASGRLPQAVAYPQVAMFERGHSPLAWEVVERGLKPIWYRRELDPFGELHKYLHVQCASKLRVILSSEDFSVLDRREARKLSLRIPAVDKIVITARSTTAAFDSWWKAEMLSGRTVSRAAAIQEFLQLRPYDYGAFAMDWVSVFPDADVVILSSSSASRLNPERVKQAFDLEYLGDPVTIHENRSMDASAYLLIAGLAARLPAVEEIGWKNWAAARDAIYFAVHDQLGGQSWLVPDDIPAGALRNLAKEQDRRYRTLKGLGLPIIGDIEDLTLEDPQSLNHRRPIGSIHSQAEYELFVAAVIRGLLPQLIDDDLVRQSD